MLEKLTNFPKERSVSEILSKIQKFLKRFKYVDIERNDYGSLYTIDARFDDQKVKFTINLGDYTIYVWITAPSMDSINMNLAMIHKLID